MSTSEESTFRITNILFRQTRQPLVKGNTRGQLTTLPGQNLPSGIIPGAKTRRVDWLKYEHVRAAGLYLHKYRYNEWSLCPGMTVSGLRHGLRNRSYYALLNS